MLTPPCFLTSQDVNKHPHTLTLPLPKFRGSPATLHLPSPSAPELLFAVYLVLVVRETYVEHWRNDVPSGHLDGRQLFQILRQALKQRQRWLMLVELLAS